MIHLEALTPGNAYLIDEREIACVVVSPRSMMIYMKGGHDKFELLSEEIDLNRARVLIASAMADGRSVYRMSRKGETT